MPHLSKEAELIMKNLIPFLKHKYRAEVLHYFTEEVKMDATEDEWDLESKWVTCKTDGYLEEEFENKIKLDEAIIYIKE